jgi:hypothetical protein
MARWQQKAEAYTTTAAAQLLKEDLKTLEQVSRDARARAHTHTHTHLKFHTPHAKTKPLNSKP